MRYHPLPFFVLMALGFTTSVTAGPINAREELASEPSAYVDIRIWTPKDLDAIAMNGEVWNGYCLNQRQYMNYTQEYRHDRDYQLIASIPMPKITTKDNPKVFFSVYFDPFDKHYTRVKVSSIFLGYSGLGFGTRQSDVSQFSASLTNDVTEMEHMDLFVTEKEPVGVTEKTNKGKIEFSNEYVHSVNSDKIVEELAGWGC